VGESVGSISGFLFALPSLFASFCDLAFDIVLSCF
jgi:hypothetical protein